MDNHDSFIKEVEIIDCLNEIIDSIELKINQNSDKNIQNVKEYIDEHYLEDLSLENIETEFCIDKFKLIRRFKKIYNSTPSAYQLQLKVNHAKQLMKTENVIVNLALSAGFYDQAHFTKEFKKSTGMTPGQYMKSVNTLED